MPGLRLARWARVLTLRALLRSRMNWLVVVPPSLDWLWTLALKRRAYRVPAGPWLEHWALLRRLVHWLRSVPGSLRQAWCLPKGLGFELLWADVVKALVQQAAWPLARCVLG